MPSTPPSERSPASLNHTVNIPLDDISTITVQPSQRSTSYLTRHRRTPRVFKVPSQSENCGIQPEPIPAAPTERTIDEGTSVPRKGTLKSISQVGRQFSLFPRAKTKWPDPEQSVGKFCGIKGRYSYWEAKGPAQEIFIALGLEIAALLERSCGPVPSSSQVIYDIFMVGEAPNTAIPHIMFSCRKSEPRKAAMETLKKSGLLSNYRGIETGHWQFPPHIMDPRLLAFRDGLELNTQWNGLKVLLVPSHVIASTTSPESLSKTISAMRLYTPGSPDSPNASLKATVGSLVVFAGKTFYVTVSHAFFEDDHSDRDSAFGTTDDDDDSGFEFGGFDGEEDALEEEFEITGSGSMTSESSGTPDDFNEDIDESFESLSLAGSDVSTKLPLDMIQLQIRDSVELKVQEPFQNLLNIRETEWSDASVAAVFLVSASLDYALIEPESKGDLAQASKYLPIISMANAQKIPPGETPIMTVTGSSGLLFGTLSGRPSYVRLISTTTFQETFTVTIDGPIIPGDSGSIIMSQETREVYGHMVVGSTVSRIAYIIPAINVLKDMKLREEDIQGTTSKTEAPTVHAEHSDEEITPRLRPDFKSLPALVTFQLETSMVATDNDSPPCRYASSWCSEVESIFSENDSIASSNSSEGEFRSSALSEIVDLLLSSELKELYPAAITKLGPEKFQRNFKRFLRRYGRELQQEASNHLERQAALLVRISAIQIAIQIRESIVQGTEKTTPSGPQPERQSKAVQLNDWLESVKGQENQIEEDDSSDNSGSDEWEPHDDTSLATLENVKGFMVSGNAFTSLCKTFQDWLKLGHDPKGKRKVVDSPTSDEWDDSHTSAYVEEVDKPTTLFHSKEVSRKGKTSALDSGYSTSDDDDEEPSTRGRQLENLAELQAAIRILEGHNRTPSSSSASKGEANALRFGMAYQFSPPLSSDSDEEEDTTIGKSQKFPPLVRNRSGHLVRPALRRVQSQSKIGPTFSKAVHFDSNLDDVRHFLKEDRPLAVSAGSSPVEAYDSDSEFPFNDGPNEELSRDSWEWELVVSNFPEETPERMKLPVRLERLFLSADDKSLVGHVAVANLAFDKNVVARFTLDYWKTTSEVVAWYYTYIRQPEQEGYDRFMFNINLSDLANLEAKTMFLCVKYSVNDQVYWDNNNAINFQIDFRKKMKAIPQRPKTLGYSPTEIPRSKKSSNRKSSPPKRPVSFDDFAHDYQTKYEFSEFRRPVHDHPEAAGGRPRLKGVKSAASSVLDDPTRPLVQPSSQAFANRYDFGASLTAAIQAANATLDNNRKSGLSSAIPKPLKTFESPKVRPGSQMGAFTKSYDFGASISQDIPASSTTLLENNQNPSGIPALGNESYEQLINKYCFFGSAEDAPAAESGERQAGI